MPQQAPTIDPRPLQAAQPNPSLILRHMPSLDSIRGAAILMVIGFHGFGSYAWRPELGSFWGSLAQATVGCGRFGVNLFFVLSGFLITTLLFKGRERPHYYRNFYTRRALRILPVYLLVLAVVWGCGIISTRFLVAALLFLANFSRLFGAPMKQFGALWSLAVEEHFYLLWPTAVRHLRESTLLKILAGVLIGEPVLRLLAIHLLNHIDIHYKTPFVLDYIAYGALLAVLLRQGRVHAGNAARIGGTVLAASSMLILLVIFGEAFHTGKTLDALGDLPFTWAACGILLLGLKRDHARLGRTGSAEVPGARGILPFYGYISYGLYLINGFVYAFLGEWLIRHIAPDKLHNFAVWSAQASICIGVSTGAAFVSRRFFEGPILAWSGGKPKTASVAVHTDLPDANGYRPLTPAPIKHLPAYPASMTPLEHGGRFTSFPWSRSRIPLHIPTAVTRPFQRLKR